MEINMSEEQKDKKKELVSDILSKAKCFGSQFLGYIKKVDVNAIVGKVKDMVPKKSKEEAKNDSSSEDDKKSKQG